MKKIISTIIVLLAITFAHSANAAICRVTGVAGPLTFATISAALDVAPCTVILVSAGTYTENITIDRAVRIHGESAATTIIDGGSADRVFNISVLGNVLISDVTIQNGYTTSEGAGVSVDGRVILDNVIVQNNTARSSGGGVACISGGLTLSNVTVTANHANAGGALYNEDCKTVSIFNSSLTNHSVDGEGGAIYSLKGVTLKGVTVSNNMAGSSGGGIWVRGHAEIYQSMIDHNMARSMGGGINFEPDSSAISFVMTDTTVSVNEASRGGGGLAMTASDSIAARVSIVSSLFDHNIASEGGGAIYSYISYELRNSTITDNSATSPRTGSGGGLYQTCYSSTSDRWARLNNVTIADNSANSGGGIGISTTYTDTCEISYVLSNTIVSDNDGGDCITYAGTNIVSLGYNLSSDDSCYLTSIGDIVGESAELDSLDDNGGFTETLMPNSGSPVINAGGNLYCEDVDQRGVVRPVDVVCDMGAVEVE